MALTAILNTDGAPVDPGLLHTLLDVAPFARDHDVWTDGPIGLASAPLRSSVDHLDEPVLVRDHLCLVFDGRLDDRATLCEQLAVTSPRDETTRADIELVAAAYEKWGPACARHLLGDFAFCIWDRRRRSLVAARDRFGVKPFYVVRTGRTLVLSSVLRGLRRHPLVSDRFDDQTIGDLLLFGLGMDPARTPFADIGRLPPAHVLEYSGNGDVDRVHRFWSLNPGEVDVRRDRGGLVEAFASALQRAVADRARGRRAAIFMSGGLDSSSIAAIAAGLEGPSATGGLRALTGIYATAAEDCEQYYASIVADALNIGIDFLPLDRYVLFERWDRGGLPPEPTTEPMTAVTADLLARAAGYAAVVLTGDGGDPLLLPSSLFSQIGRVPFRRLMAGFWHSIGAHDRPPIGLRSSLTRRRTVAANAVPRWLADPLLRVFDPAGRWLDIQRQRTADRGARSAAVNNLIDPWWASTFETYDPGAMVSPVAMSYPFFDPRVVDAALQVPSFPLCANKRLLREAMRGELPEAVRVRPKTPLAVLPESFHGKWSLADAVRAIDVVPDMRRYVDRHKFETTVNQADLFTSRAPGTLAAVSVATWLRCSTTAAVHA